MRLFFALWPPAGAARALAEWARQVKQGSGGRATAEEAIHLTLAFLGEGDPANASQAARGVGASSFALRIDTAKYWKHNRIVWVGPAGIPAGLQRLVGDLHPSLKAAGFALEDRPFAAHISLIRKANSPASLPPLPALDWPVREFVLVRSTPRPAGSRYQVLERFALA